MFTGIIEEIGTVRDIHSTGKGKRITVGCNKTLGGTKIGDSINIDGCCQTVVELTPKSFSVEAVTETIHCTNFTNLRPGSRVNLERSLLPIDRLGGHFVQGHVDGVGIITKIVGGHDDKYFSFLIDNRLSIYVVLKGSIAINGVSLTVASLERDEVSVTIIPHTMNATNFRCLSVNSKVNIEVDLIGKYIAKLFAERAKVNEFAKDRRLQELLS